MEVVWGQPKWIITNHTKCQSSSKEGDVVYMVGFAGNPLLWAFPGKPNDSFQQVLYAVRPTESSSQTENALSSIRITQDRMFLWWPGKSCSSLAEKFWYIHCIHQTLHLWCPFILVFTKFSSWEKKKITIPWKAIKGTSNSPLLRKIKSFEKTELWSCLKNGRK